MASIAILNGRKTVEAILADTESTREEADICCSVEHSISSRITADATGGISAG